MRRRSRPLESSANENKADLRTIELDVASQESVDPAIQEIVRDNGRIDILIHNAGDMVLGSAEAFTPEQLAELYDVNVLSTRRVNRAALPQLRKQRRRLVVWSRAAVRRVERRPISRPILRPRLGWMPWRWSMPAN
jgi:NADP-dependent 3-hydroxy acid dehydrogenase YdfG